MKRFLLFAGQNYYPSGGWSDFYNSFETLDAAKIEGMEMVDEFKNQWWHVVDIETLEVVAEG